MEMAWAQADNNHTHFRMETAWAQAGVDYSPQNNKAQSPLEDVHHVSPLMARSDSTDVTRRRGGRITDTQIQPKNDTPTDCLIKQPPIKLSLIEQYRTFLQKHEPSLDILERIMERFVFYRYLFNHDHSGMKIELYYAAWNIIRWVNDVVLMGWGDGMGMTIGTRNDWLGHETTGTQLKDRTTFQNWVLSRMHMVVPILRAILTVTTCVYPALEAWARRPISSRPNYGTALPCNESQQQVEWKYATTTDLAPKTRRLNWETRQSRAAELSYGVERIRFVSRLALLSISWWARRNREQNNKEKVAAVPSLIRRGGELDPCEDLLPLAAVDTAAAVTQYKGKRTGRRSTSTTAPASNNAKGTSFVRHLGQLISSKHNILYFHIVGELLHILRPLYWSRSESIDWKQRANASNGNQARRNSKFSLSLWRAWLMSLIMDVVSDELLDITTGCTAHQATGRYGKRPSLFSRSTRQNAPASSVSSVLEREQEELTWRRGRRSMYLLRSPAYGAITLPIMTAFTRVISKIPSFGLGRWASEYILDMMSYWNEHRFMLE